MALRTMRLSTTADQRLDHRDGGGGGGGTADRLPFPAGARPVLFAGRVAAMGRSCTRTSAIATILKHIPLTIRPVCLGTHRMPVRQDSLVEFVIGGR